MPFNWDNIDCASPNLENSAHFFSIQHAEHEKEYFDCLNMDKENEENTENCVKDPMIIEKVGNVVEHVKEECITKVQEVAKVDKEKGQTTKKVPLKTRVNIQHEAPKNFAKVIKKNEKNLLLNGKPRKQVKPEIKKPQKIVDQKKDKKPLTSQPVKITKVHDNKKHLNNLKKPVQATQVVKKFPDFRAKPAPNFKLLHEKQKKVVRQQPTVTVPQTPVFLRKSQVQQKKTESKRVVMKASVKIVPVLKKEPFCPKKEKKITQAVPFNFQTNRRHEERLRFEDVMRQVREIKLQKGLEEKKKQEDNLRRQLRKATEFKARPNPFK